jgi:hypothetical protein
MPTPGWGTRPQDIIAEAKARAKAALKEENPKLTSLERAFRARRVNPLLTSNYLFSYYGQSSRHQKSHQS